MCQAAEAPRSIRGGSRADSMVGLTALTENPAGYRTTCVSREICAQGMCATCNTIAGVTAKFYNVHGVGHRKVHHAHKFSILIVKHGTL